MDIQGDNLALEILKWAGIVLAAGFVGYFGRYLAMLIIDRIHKKKASETPVAKPVRETPVTQETGPETVKLDIEKQKAKIEKKKAKADAKRAKKELKK